MSKDTLEDICDGIQYHMSINRVDACYNIGDCIKQGQAEWKRALVSSKNIGKGLHKAFKAVVNDILHALIVLVESGL